MKKPSSFLLALMLLLAAGCGAGDTSGRVADMVKKLNSKCPAMVDEETMLKRVDYDKKQTIRYVYHLVHVQSEKVDTVAFRKALWPGLLANIKVDHELKDLRDSGFIFVYEYADAKGRPISALSIGPDDYR